MFSDPNWDFKTLNWDTHVDQTLKASAAMDALDPNLKPYFDRGGKIISYHGWADPQISPGSTVELLRLRDHKPWAAPARCRKTSACSWFPG